MLPIHAKIVKKPISADRLLKYIRNGVANGITVTAKEARDAVVTGVKTKFRNKGTWFAEQSPIGIKVIPATADGGVKAGFGAKKAMTAIIYTNTYFGELQEMGGIKLPFSGSHLAIPARVGPLSKMRRIPPELGPKALIMSGKGFIVTTEKGTKLIVVQNYKERGKYKGVVVMYVLVSKAKVKRTDFFQGPIKKVVAARLDSNIASSVDKQLGKLGERS